MPTAHPRYQVTDTGRVRAILDRAASTWPELAGDRKGLLLRLAETGAERIAAERTEAEDLETELSAYVGQWVAIRDGRLLVARDDVTDVVAWIRAHRERAGSIFRVPQQDEEPATEHGLA